MKFQIEIDLEEDVTSIYNDVALLVHDVYRRLIQDPWAEAQPDTVWPITDADGAEVGEARFVLTPAEIETAARRKRLTEVLAAERKRFDRRPQYEPEF